MADRNPKSEIRNPKLDRLVSLLLHWFSSNARDLPWRSRKARLDPYAIWVSEIMLQQTQVKTVIPYWERWLSELPTIKSVAIANQDKIHKLWEGLGYYTRVRNLQKAAKQIVEKHGGKFPKNFDDVLALPGIGRYTAGAVCSIAFNQPRPILDGNVIRVLTRIFGIGKNPREKETNARLWKLAEELVALAGGARVRRAQIKNQGSRDSRPTENENCSNLNQSLMELGALICTPRNPQCGICPIKKLCVAFRENRVGELPDLGKRQIITARRFAAFVVEQNGRFLVRQRPAGVANAHLWEFPNTELLNGNSSPKIAAKAVLGIMPSEIEPLCTVKHSITRYRITLEAFRTSPGGASSSGIGVWKTRAKLEQLAFSSAHKKILEKLAVHPK
jgi:A/G-specific adenine glycosylase